MTWRQRFGIMGIVAILGVLGMVPTMAKATAADAYPYNNCNYMGVTTTSYAYGSGSTAVYAGGWRHYYDDGQATGGSDCEHINVITGYNGTGTATVRIQFCPDADGKGPSFSCYSMGWATIPDVPGCHCGISVHSYHFPATNPVNWHFYYRLETQGSSEQVNIIV